MAEAIGVASGIIALVSFGVKASSSLLATIKEFNQSTIIVAQLVDELIALENVLESLKNVIQDTEVDLTALECPLQRCTKICQEFERTLSESAGSSQSARDNFRNWKKLKFLDGDINQFKDAITGYKLTIVIALCTINIRTTQTNKRTFEQYQQLMSVTSNKLQLRLEDVNDKLESYPPNTTAGSAADLTMRNQIMEEKETVLVCLEFCDDFSSTLAKLRRRVAECSFTGASGRGETDGVKATAASACRAVANDVTECKSCLEDYLGRLNNEDGKQGSCDSSDTIHPEEENLTQEQRSLKDRLRFIQFADEDASCRQRANHFENIYTGDGSRQFIASTLNELIFANNIRSGNDSTLVCGQFSDETIQALAASINVGAVESAPRRSEGSSRRIERRRGGGRTRFSGYKRA